jgi:acetylornithine deacetylase/succinyl-diaminopimelate desuccinylase-like protein
MLSHKTKPTTKKFYGKWLYKASFQLEGCVLFRTKTLEEVNNFCLGPEPETHYWHATNIKAYANRETILDLSNFLGGYTKEDYNLRIESSFFDVYTNNPKFYNSVSNRFAGMLRHRFEPDAATAELLNENKNYISVKKLPKERYNYRVYLLPHKMAKDREGKQKFVNWLKAQSPRITCTPAIEKWFVTTDWNWDRRYVLVEDESMLLMMKLRNADVVGKIYNFVISDK